MRALSLVALVGLWGCSSQRGLTLSPALPSPCGNAPLVELRVSGVGDFVPLASGVASSVVAADLATQLALELPRDTRVITVQGDGAGAPSIGRTAPFQLESVWNDGGGVSIAFGPENTFCPTASLVTARSSHLATLLSDGSVLFTGGVDADGTAVASLERYLPSGDHASSVARFQNVEGMIDPTSALGASATTLADGRVLLAGGAPAGAGGSNGIAYGGAQLLDAQGVPDGPPRVLDGGARAYHAAVTLADGRVLLAGGCSELASGACASGHALASAVLYDPSVDRFTIAPSLVAARWHHQAILRSDGLVSIVGGVGADGAAREPEVYDPTQQRGFALAGPAGTSVALDSGLVVGLNDASAPTAVAVAWSGISDDVSPLPQLPGARQNGTVTALEDGTVLFAGGNDGAVLAGRSALIAGDGVTSMALDGFVATGHTATRLLDGTVLLAGGIGSDGVQASATIFLRSLVGPFSSPATLGFDGPTPLTPSRPDSAAISSGALAVTSTSSTALTDFAVLAGPRLAGPSGSGFSVDLLASAQPGAKAAILFGSFSTSRYVAIVFAPHAAPTVLKVTPSQPGLVDLKAQGGCTTTTLSSDELPVDRVAPLALSVRGGRVELRSTRTLLRCSTDGWPDRGELALGALNGTVRYDNVTLVR